MKKASLFLIAACISTIAYTQKTESQKLIELGEAYKNFMFVNDPTKEIIKGIKAEIPENLNFATDFIIQTISKKNKLLESAFLTRPGDEILKQVYIIREINLNMREETQVNNLQLIDSLMKRNIPVYELIDNYYEMIFTSVGNKNQPFNLSKTDFKLNDYNLKDETEKGIFVLKALSFCGTTIWGYMNIPKPANTKLAFEYISKFPKINGLSYYQYTNFYFLDFEITIDKANGPQSYKSYYLNKLYETLLYHLICLNKEGASEKEKNALLLGSILKEKNLYKYTSYKQTLEDIFKEVKTEQ